MNEKNKTSQQYIIEKYMNYVLMFDSKPKSVYLFSKDNDFEESEFYKYYASFDAIENDIFNQFFNNTISILEKSEDYKNYDSRNKLLSFYYTFFENLTANRSFVVFILSIGNKPIENLKRLSSLRSAFIKYVSELDIQTLQLKQKKLEEVKEKALTESYWAQLLFTINFWIDDNSISFEKTDLYIEKSINASFDIINISPLKSVIDFGKFLFKEKINLN